MNDLIGTRLDRYEIRDVIGRGGMATVYRAYQESLNREVAVKVLAGQLAQDEDFRQRFDREAKAVAQLNHAYILPVYDYGEDRQRDLVYFVTQLVEGGTLSRSLGQPLPVAEAVRIASGVAQALDYAHRHGIIHRDVKPSNILLTEDGRPLLTDFGIAQIMQETRLTRTGTSLGTAQYMSPEQARGEPLGPRADVYALAIVLYEMLIGRPPFEADTDIAILHQQVYESPTPPRQRRSDIPRRLEKVLLKALSKEPAKRYPTAGALAQALERALKGGILPPGRGATPVRPPLAAEAEPATIIRESEGAGAPRIKLPSRRKVGRFLLQATKWVFGKLVAAAIVLALIAVVLLISGAFALSAVVERTVATHDWGWERWDCDGGQISVILEEDIQQPLRDTVEPYALDAATNISADFRPPDIVAVVGYLGRRVVTLQARLSVRGGVLHVQLERLNAVPLYVIGGIISNGINRGMDSAWREAPAQLATLEVQDDRIRALLEPTSGPNSRSPTPTAVPRNAVVHVVNQLDYAVAVVVGSENLELDAGEESEIELHPGGYAYSIYADDRRIAEGQVTWNSGYQEWIIRQ
jgi:tRNA A-37 threonylcarbamoyl transferase component Bud32